MATTLGNIVADFNTTLNLKVAVGAEIATLDSATDDDGVALPTGTYYLTIDDNNSSKEYIQCTLTSTSLTAIKSFSRQGAVTTGFARTHRKGAVVKITDFGILRNILDAIDGTDPLGLTVLDLAFSGTATTGLKVKSLTTTQRNAASNQANGNIIYNTTTGEFNIYQGGSWSVISSGSTQPDASATVAGKVEIATSAQSIAGTDTGETGASLVVLPSDIKTNLFTATQGQASVYGLDAGGDDTYVVALTPVLAAYTAGQKLSFKSSTANTGACSINFGPGVLNIKTKDGNDPQTGVIRANTVVTGAYDGTNFVLDTEDFATATVKGTVEMATDAEVVTGTDETRYINPKQLSDLTSFAPNTNIPNTYFTYQIPISVTSTSAAIGWTYVGAGGNALAMTDATTANILGISSSTLTTSIMGPGSGYYQWGSTKTIRIKARMLFAQGGSNIWGFGLCNNGSDCYAAQTDVNYAVRFVNNAGTLYAHNANNSAATATNVTGSLTLSDYNVYEIIFDPGTNAKFYINGVLVATHTTNLPTAASNALLGYAVSGNGRNILTSFPIVSLEM